MEKKTPLYEQHVALKGRIVPFAGYLLPVQYPTGVIAEHMAVRQHVGLFDVSHMGEALIEGPQAEQALNYILSNQFTGMPVGKARYTLMLNETGGVVDDLIVYRRSETSFFLVLNAANTEKDLAWLRAHLQGEASLTDLSDRVAQIAVQGPEADKVLSGLADLEALPKKYYSFVEHVTVLVSPAWFPAPDTPGKTGMSCIWSPKTPRRFGRRWSRRGPPPAAWARATRCG